MSLDPKVSAEIDAARAVGRRKSSLVAMVLLESGMSEDWIHSVMSQDAGIAMLQALSMLGNIDAAAVLRLIESEVPEPLHPLPIVPGAGDADLIHDGIVQTIGRRIGELAETVTISGCSPAIDGTYTRTERETYVRDADDGA